MADLLEHERLRSIVRSLQYVGFAVAQVKNHEVAYEDSLRRRQPQQWKKRVDHIYKCAIREMVGTAQGAAQSRIECGRILWLLFENGLPLPIDIGLRERRHIRV